MVSVLSDLGLNSFFDGAYPLARTWLEEGLALSRKFGIRDDTRMDSSTWLLSMVAALQGEAERAERMVREWTARLLASEDRMLRAYGLYMLGNVLEFCGQYAAAEPILEEGVARLRELGADVLLYRLQVSLLTTKLHVGQYERARELGREEVGRARQTEAWYFVGVALTRLAQVSLTTGACKEATLKLEDSMAALRQGAMRAWLGEALGCMAHVMCRSGRVDQAWEYVDQALRLALDCQAAHPLLLTLSAMALLLADQGQPERAVELYALACRSPVVSNSRWYEDVAGRELAAVSAALPVEVCEAAQARGRARDLWATAQELLEEIER